MQNKYLNQIFSLSLLLIISTSCNNPEEKKSTNDTVVSESVHPSWSENANIYEVNLRQYTPEGTITAFETHLSRLKDMGVKILWFMPITPIGVEGRKMTEKDMGSYYAVKNYTAFNADYGTMDEWKAFVKHAHEMGFKVITDWVANHTSPDNHWMKAHPDFYAKDSTGKVIAPFDWTDVRKLDYKNQEMRDSMIAAMSYWVTETDVDGFRCDVAEEVPVDFWKKCIESLHKIKNVFMLAEGEKPELHGAGFDETYAWAMMHLLEDIYKGEKSVKQVDSLINAQQKRFPENAYRRYFTSNHDENSWNGTEFEKYGDAVKTFAVFSQTMYQSVPLIYNGQEMMNKKRLRFFTKDTISWSGNQEMAMFYKTLLTERNSNPALAADASFKRLSTSADSLIFAYQREKAGKKVIVVLNLSSVSQKFTVSDIAINGNPKNLFSGKPESLSNTQQMSKDKWGYAVYVY